MFLDASVIVAILLREDGFEDIVKRIEEHSGRFFCSPLARYEASVSLARALRTSSRLTPELIRAAQDDVNNFLAEIDARDVTINTGIGQAAIDAAGQYGKVVGHPAALNFGDCFSYACAKAHRLSLLYKGNDFSQTDLA